MKVKPSQSKNKSENSVNRTGKKHNHSLAGRIKKKTKAASFADFIKNEPGKSLAVEYEKSAKITQAENRHSIKNKFMKSGKRNSSESKGNFLNTTKKVNVKSGKKNAGKFEEFRSVDRNASSDTKTKKIKSWKNKPNSEKNYTSNERTNLINAQKKVENISANSKSMKLKKKKIAPSFKLSEGTDEESSENKINVSSQLEAVKKTKNKRKEKILNEDESELNTPGEKKIKMHWEETSAENISKPVNIKKQKDNVGSFVKTKGTKQERNSDTEEAKTEKEDAPLLPGAINFWNIPVVENNEESSDDENEGQNATMKQKRKKPTPAEKAELARLEEERIRKIEIELADSDSVPKTADHFDRLVLANPNNSIVWINYMAFHLEATEIENARSVSRKALSAIEFREEQEKLNIWIALLNLENRYGSSESFQAVLKEAVQMNDPLTVYLQALNILSESKKVAEFSELLAVVSRKFKQAFNMWTEAANACYQLDLKEEARNLMQRALKSLDEKLHVNLIVQFAFMESRNNDPERAEALLEKILASYPKRIDVWTSYVDMLLKGNRIHIARNVLERAASQKLPAKKMKTIFTKYVQFETQFGDEERVRKIKNMAAAYVKTVAQ